MSKDILKKVRRVISDEINSSPGDRQSLEEKHGQVWDTADMQKDFTALGFLAPYIVVRRKSDGVKGSLAFQHHTRFYFSFKEDTK